VLLIDVMTQLSGVLFVEYAPEEISKDELERGYTIRVN
jgi:hypothetical protein